jgi:ribosomal-protein-alanine N-acetyltransferase
VTEQFNFGPFPCLETERLCLRQITWNDIPALYQLFSDPVVTQYNDVTTFNDRHDAENLFHFLQDRYRRRIGIRWALTLKGVPAASLIGTCGYNIWSRHNNCGEIGYDLMRRYWNQGYVTEAIRAILYFGFQQMSLNRIEADVMRHNAASMRVLEKLGFQREGVLRQRGYWKGAYHDLYFFSLLREDFYEDSDGRQRE